MRVGSRFIAISVLLQGLFLGDSANADESQPRITDRDSGREIVTVVEDLGVQDSVSSGDQGFKEEGVGSAPNDLAVVSDPHCVATNPDPIDSWCMDQEGVADEVLVPSPHALAIRATNELKLPDPKPQFVPRIKDRTGQIGGIVGLPMWLWVDSRDWPTLRQRTTAGANWASVTARPVAQVWNFGDGNSVRCNGPGQPYRDGNAYNGQTPACSYRYLKSSRKQARGQYGVRVTVVWEVTWVGSGDTSGRLGPLDVSTSFPYVVREARAQLVAP